MKTWTRISVVVLFALVLGVLPAQAQTTPAQPPQQALREQTTQVLKTMRDEKISTQKAFDDGLLTKEILLFALGENSLLDRVNGQLSGTRESNQWSQLLVGEFPELLAPELLANPKLPERPGELSINAQIKIARWFFLKHDPRGEQMLENILKSLPRENPDLNLAATIILLLSQHYSAIGEYEKSIAASLRIQEFTKSTEFAAQFIYNAARAAEAAGDASRAQQFYEQLTDSDNWSARQAFTGLVLLLEKTGRKDEVRALLENPGKLDRPEELRALLASQLAQQHFQRGEWDAARKWAATTIQYYNAVTDETRKTQVKYLLQTAQQMPEQIARWEKTPVQLYPQNIKVRLNVNQSEAARTYFNIQSYRDFTAVITCENPHVQVWPVQSPNNQSARTSQMIGVEIAPGAFPKTATDKTETELTVSFAEFPGTILKIPLAIVFANPN